MANFLALKVIKQIIEDIFRKNDLAFFRQVFLFSVKVFQTDHRLYIYIIAVYDHHYLLVITAWASGVGFPFSLCPSDLVIKIMVGNQNRVNRYPSTTATRKYKTSALKKASICFFGFW